VIDGGRPQGNAFPSKDPLTDHQLRCIRCEYRLVLAGNYINLRLSEESKAQRQEVASDCRLLAQEAREEGISSDENMLRIAMELRNKHGIMRQEAANFLALMAFDSEVFGADASLRAAWHLVCDLGSESRAALYAIGFRSHEIRQLKFHPNSREQNLLQIMREKKLIG
jgi:hypothetical protein